MSKKGINWWKKLKMRGQGSAFSDDSHMILTWTTTTLVL